MSNKEFWVLEKRNPVEKKLEPGLAKIAWRFFAKHNGWAVLPVTAEGDTAESRIKIK